MTDPSDKARPTQMKGKRKQIPVWVGIVDDKPYEDKDENYGVKRLHVFRSRRAARKCFQCVVAGVLTYREPDDE